MARQSGCPPGRTSRRPRRGAKLEAALDFLGFIASVEGVDAITAQVAPNGPYLIKGSTLPDTVLPAVQDLASYID